MNIYNLKLHETMTITSECGVMRVPGGWIYYTGTQNGPNSWIDYTGVFVPYNDEFKSKEVIE